jgi:hypothetical protein
MSLHIPWLRAKEAGGTANSEIGKFQVVHFDLFHTP